MFFLIIFVEKNMNNVEQAIEIAKRAADKYANCEKDKFIIEEN